MSKHTYHVRVEFLESPGTPDRRIVVDRFKIREESFPKAIEKARMESYSRGPYSSKMVGLSVELPNP